MTTANRIRFTSGGFAVICLGLIYAALLNLPPTAPGAAPGPARIILYILAAMLPVAIPIGVTLIRRATAAEVEAQAARQQGLTFSDLLGIVEQTPLPIAILDRELRYVAHSARWTRAYRLSDTTLVGRHHYDVFPEIPGRWKVIHQQCLAGATKHNPCERFPRLDGRVDWMRWTVQPWTAGDGQVAGIVMLTEVITEQMEAERALSDRLAELEAAHAQLEAAASVARLGYWIWHPATGDFEASSGIHALLGMEDTLVSMDALQRRMPIDEREIFVARLRRALKRSERFSHQVTILGDDGARHLVRMAGHMERGADGDVSRVVGVLMDATDMIPAASESTEVLPAT